MEIEKREDEKIVEIGRSEISILGEVTSYLFLVKMNGGKRQYGISIVRGSEGAIGWISDSLLSSVAFFESMVKGEVFPYSLEEFLDDFWKNEKNSAGESSETSLQIT